jgi:hypothetical protein
MMNISKVFNHDPNYILLYIPTNSTHIQVRRHEHMPTYAKVYHSHQMYKDLQMCAVVHNHHRANPRNYGHEVKIFKLDLQ